MKTVKKRSQKQEKSVAKDFSAKTVVASGALWGAKGDVRNDRFLIECKTTKKDYYSLTATVWEKIEDEAIRDRGRIPLMIIDLEDKDRLVVFRHSYFNIRAVPQPYDCTSNGDNKKSFRVSLKDLEEAEKDFGGYVYARLFLICGKRKNMLFFMRYKDFEERVEKEALE